VFDEKIINWLLDDDNPAIKYRTQTELLDQSVDITQAKAWIFSKLPENWYETKGLWYGYYITALAECGLSYKDIPAEHLKRALDNLNINFECGCADFMLLTSLMKLGLSEHKTILNIIDNLAGNNLPDGGFLCLRRLNKLKYTPKSCYKTKFYALMFLAECHKKGIDSSFGQPLIDYFLNRNIFYKSTDESTLVLNSREGWRIIDTFHPFEPMRMGIHNVVETFSALGYGKDERLDEAWVFLNNYKDSSGKIILSNTLTKSYLPKERVGKPSKWATFYTLIAQKEKSHVY
jgi:hypothetical protein